MRAAETKEFEILITRFLSGEASSRERDRIHTLRVKPEFDSLYIEIRRIWGLTRGIPTLRFAANGAMKRLADAIKERND